ncbi:spindle and kinetochore-associated protein 1-like [Thrips palmi]|uniref:SKA complex subunit 1 n=1 Tax=Thrips palmi TaxID=161013 RepID=A0A6P8YQD5_THRPL|nr:spindle and kinetochore-associated protein 1-like [Thrips palmi]
MMSADSTKDDANWVSFDEVPSFLLNLAERIQILEQAACLFRGWDSEINELKSATISALSNCRRGIEEMKKYGKALEPQFEASSAKQNDLRRLKHKMQFILNNIPDRFNCPSNIAQLNSEVEKTDQLPVEETQMEPSQTTIKEKSTIKIPDILFLTVDEFEKVPKYMKGRVTYEKLNAFIEVFNKVLLQKYTIFKKKKSTLKKRDADLWNEFNKQELKETKGLYFCVGNDFKTFNGFSLDKMSLNMITILRHCGRLRELRTGGILRYVAMF